MLPGSPFDLNGRLIHRKQGQGLFRVLSVALLLTCCLPGILWSQHLPPPLLLSFNLASDWDIGTLEKLQLQQPATYFVTPQVAQAYPGLIRKLGKNNSVGLLYTASTPSRNRFEIRQELAAARQALAVITGQEPVWFRSVPDQWHSQTLELAREAGFRYDSSESERKLVQDVLPEFPVAASASGIWKSIALWKEGYRQRTITGRPYIVQVGMHTIDAYPEDLPALIDFVKNQGGQCLTYDGYLRTLESVSPRYTGVYLDLSRGEPDPEQVVREATKAGITDIFLMAQDAAGQKYYRVGAASEATAAPVFVTLAKQLRAASIRVHAWIAVNRNEQVAVNHPELAMVDLHGERSTRWISPSHPKNAELKLTVHELIVNHDLDGIHLDYLGYPSLDFDFSQQAVRTFEQAYGEKISWSTPRTLLSAAYRDRWSSWRSQQLQAMVLDAASTISGFSAKRLILSGALDASAVTDHRQMEASAQDLSLLANGLDLIVVKVDLPSLTGNLWGERLAITPRLLAGNRPLLLGCPFSRSSLSKETGWSAQMEAALPWTQGVAYDYGGHYVQRAVGGQQNIELKQKTILPDSQISEGPQAQQVVGQADGETLEFPRPDVGKETIELTQRTALPDSQVSEEPQPEQAVAKAEFSTLSKLRYGLLLVGAVILLMVFAMRTFTFRRKKSDVSEQPEKEEEKVSTIVLAEFLAGFIYTIRQVTPDPDIGQAGSTMAVILTSGDYFTMFYINHQRKASVSPDSQILVTTSDIPKLSDDAYVDTTRLIEGNEGGFRIEGLVGLVPDRVKKAIRKQIASSQVIPQERQEQILREFK